MGASPFFDGFDFLELRLHANDLLTEGLIKVTHFRQPSYPDRNTEQNRYFLHAA